MTDYVMMERDFVTRTIELIDQYADLVIGNVPRINEYEVTLLMNCLLGLLIYPQQIAHREQGAWGKWLTDEKVVDVGLDWGIKPEYIKYAGWTKIELDRSTGKPSFVELQVKDLTMRQLLRNMRNTAAHARFKVYDSGQKTGQLRFIEFKADPDKQGFHLELPVESLETFLRRLAASALGMVG